MNREEWLTRLAEGMIEVFDLEKTRASKWRVSVGFPSKRGLAQKNRRLGECWYPSMSEDETHEIVLSIVLRDERELAATLAHELAHVEAGHVGHKGPFRKVAQGMGLVGKMTATTGGPAFWERVNVLLEDLGEYPGKALKPGSLTTPHKQSTRMLKAQCKTCGYTVRTTRKWLEVGPPRCNSESHGLMKVDM